MLHVPAEPEYVTSAVAAKALGIGTSTLTKWAREGLLRPAFTTPGGQYRWVIEDLRKQLKVWRPDE